MKFEFFTVMLLKFLPSGILRCHGHPRKLCVLHRIFLQLRLLRKKPHYCVNEQTETMLPHKSYDRLIFHTKESQNFITELVMQNHVYCALRKNNVKTELMTHFLSHAFQCNALSYLILPTIITDDRHVIKNE